MPVPTNLFSNNPLSGGNAIIGSTLVPGSESLLGELPWAQPIVNSAFFEYLVPKGELWDKLMPYRLVVMDVSQNPPQVVQGNDPSAVQVNPLGNGTLAFTPLSSAWEFFLPITPQQLSISDAFSINTSATLVGILEEHSGVRFKNITVQGTFGVWPDRQSISLPPGTPSILQSIFANTLTSAQNVATQFTSIINNITTGSNASKPTTVRPGDTSGGPSGGGDPDHGLSTGYYQTTMLQQFLEQYAEAKRNPANAGWRLVFDIPKQNQSFVVTPIGFTWNENVNKPMEIDYNLQLKAWRRIDLNAKLVPVPLQVTQLTPGALQNILNTIQAAQNTAAAATNLIGAVRSDVDNVLNIIRQTGILVKQLAGVALAANDLPSQLTSDTKSTISTFIATIQPSNLFGAASTDPTTLKAIAAITALSATAEGLSPTAVALHQIGSSAAASATLNPSNAVFTNPLQYPLLFSQVPVNSLTLNTAQQNALQNELNTVNAFTVQDLKNMRATMLTLCTQLSNSFGAGNAYYDTLFNQPAPLVRSEPMTLDEYNILQSFYALLESYDQLTATNELDNNQILNNMEYVSALAATSDIEFSIPNSKIQVPVPYGLTMEQIAMRYLGDPQRWLEIATLNFLQEPYLDENGFVLPLLSNAYGRNIVIGSNEDLFIGQTIYLYANGQTPTARTILNIATLSPTSFLLTLDGLANLDSFTTANQAYIQAYLPGTVNSQNVIFVPSNIITVPDDQINIPTSVANVALVGLSKVDLLLTPQGDLAIDSRGNLQLAAGITNLVQALTIKLSTQINTSLLNPDFGLNVSPGRMVSDTSAADIYNEITNLITSDPRFSGISGLQVTLQPPSLGISLGVGLSGIQGVFPVSFQLPTYQL
jgi:hypothetical protein